MTTPCIHRDLPAHAQAERPSAQAPRLTRAYDPARSAPSPSVTVRRWHRQDKRLTAIHNTLPGAEWHDRAGRWEAPLLETPRLDFLLRSRAA